MIDKVLTSFVKPSPFGIGLILVKSQLTNKLKVNPQYLTLDENANLAAPILCGAAPLFTFFAFSGKPQKIMEGLPVVRANWLKRAGCRFSPQ